MSQSPKKQPTSGELNILRVLWLLGPSRLSTICETLGKERKLAPTTVATMLKIMKDKGQVKRTISKEGVVWKPVLSREDAGSNILQNLVDRVFEGSAQKLVLHLVESGELSEEDREEIRQLLSSKTKKPKG